MNIARYTFGAVGNATFLRAAADVQEEVVERFFETEGWQYSPEFFKAIPALKQKHHLYNLGGIEIFGTFVLFIGTCFGKKIFDEIYERTLKKPVAEQLDRFFLKTTVPDGKLLEYRDVIYFEDIDLVVVIRTIVDRTNTRAVENELLQGHRVAHEYVAQHGKKSAVHCHAIANGQVMLEPLLFDSLDQMMAHDKAELRRSRSF